MIRALGWVLLLMAGCASAAEFTGRVVEIADGDTLILLTADHRQVRVRLAGIDAPEHDQPYGAQARQALAALTFEQAARVVVRDQDDYGRTVGTVYVGARDVNAALVEQGAAWVYRRYNRDPALPELEARAQAARRGLWALPERQRMAPWDWRQGKPTAEPRERAPTRPESTGRCGTKRTCGDMSSCEEARFYLTACGLKRLDRDGDGVPCERLCEANTAHPPAADRSGSDMADR